MTKLIKQLDTIKNAIAKVNAENASKISALEIKAEAIFNKLMAKKAKEIKALTIKLENSKDIASVPYDYDLYHIWVRADISQFINVDDKLEKELFREYMRENHFIDVDFENEVVSTSIVHCIVINHEGDVLDQDSGKWFIKKSDYENENELYALIESHMEKTGHFPSVVSEDYHGNVFFVNTKAA